MFFVAAPWQSWLNLCQSPRYVPPGILVILQLPRKIILVRAQVEVAVPAEAEQDGARPPFLAGEQGFVHGRADGVRRFRRRQNSLGARERHGGFEHRQLGVRPSLDLAELEQIDRKSVV